MNHTQSVVFDKLWEIRYWLIYYLDVPSSDFEIDYTYGDNDMVMVITDQLQEDLKDVPRKTNHSS
jgi:hypothetical protein